MSAMRSVHVRIEGRVQGVGYRVWLEAAAFELELGGWVRNRRDGSVEAVLHGPCDEVGEILQRCEHGPPAARVSCVEILDESAASYDGFEVRPTV